MSDNYLKLNLPVRKLPGVGKDTDATHVQVEVYYTKGGANYFSGGQDPRGLNVSVRPVKLDGGVVSFNITAGLRRHLLTLGRKSDKKGQEQAALVSVEIKNKQGGSYDVLAKVLNEFGLELVEEQAAVA